MRKVRWGILGTAAHARKALVPAIRVSANGEVMAVASRSLAKAQEFATALGIPRAYGSYEELLADTEIDAIYNPLPVSLHAPWSIKCAKAGKPTLCEKPLAATVAEARQMATAFRDAGVLLAEGMMYKYHPLTRRVRDIVRSGGVGRVVSIRASFMVNIPDGDIRLQADTGGGSLLDLGCYCAGIMRHLTGEEPVAAKAVARWLGATSVDETLAGVLQFPSGAVGYFGCGMKSFFDCSYEVMGSDGRILIDRGGMVVWPGEDFIIRHWHGDKSEEIRIPMANEYQLMVEDFGRAVMEGRQPEFPIEDSIANMQVIDDLLKSARTA